MPSLPYRPALASCRELLVASAWLLAVGCNRGDDQDAPARAPHSASRGASASPSAASSASSAAVAPGAARPGLQPPATTTTRYPPGALHSPITPAQVAAWKKIWAAHPELSAQRFIKVGDSVTASGDALYCVGREAGLLALKRDQPALFDAAAYFGAEGKYGGSFGRESQAAVVGWSAWNAIDGTKNRVWREQQAQRARVALVQFGTNDIEIGALHHFADKLFDLAEQLQQSGALPVFYTIPHRADRASAGRDVPRYNAVIRGVAQALQVPLVDYYLGLNALPRRGLSGDGIHPSTFSGPGGRDPCDMTAEGLRSGYNLRNWLSLQVLDRLRRVMTDSFTSEAPALASGVGDQSSPLQVTRLEAASPWVDFQPLQEQLTASACSKSAGRGASYRLVVSRPGRYRMLGFDRGLESDLHVYAEGASAECLGQDARKLVLQLAPGSYRVELRWQPPSSKHKLAAVAPPHVGALLVLLKE